MSMLDILSPLVLLTLMLQCHYCHGTDVPEDPTAEFSVRLYHLLQAGGDQDNIIFSPLSVAVALGMVGLGARGVSLEQIRKVAGFSHLVSGGEFSLLQNLTAPLADKEAHHVVRFANILFLQQGVTFNPEFLHLMKKYFKAHVEMVDFSQSAAVAKQINTWVENHTESMIRELMSAEDVSGITRLMLVNAIYFRGSWKIQFRPENTRTFSFSKDDGSEVQTQMMYQQGDFYYGEFSDGSQEAGGMYQVLEMPYEGEDLSMMIVLPRQEVPLSSLEPIIKAPLLEEWANNVKLQKVEVYLPRFKMEQKIDLRKTLQELGIKSVFSTEADLSSMIAGKDLYIGKAVQKAYLEVTEEGLEGAVGSGLVALTRTLVLYPQVMADHPFFFVIRDRRTGSILFMGRVMTPDVIDATGPDFDSL
ncbi:neuroserpin [Takifugu rubripes]|uniref:Serpin peptidase inhibitor, clade I (neuroserpin), member 1 n=1 Tax=Takifugu rubripes TaxID=31033 RepID=H2U3L2_TAKRU|nr:neuroserpin [Takifugu rubripes]XP_029699950.1 neuroserpin [Takifugu rubripes]|eukprot:XP_003976318.1 PREDICTED: neuroserpin [Takifugu rubripes]